MKIVVLDKDQSTFIAACDGKDLSWDMTPDNGLGYNEFDVIGPDIAVQEVAELFGRRTLHNGTMRLTLEIADFGDHGCTVGAYDDTHSLTIAVAGENNIADAVRAFADKLKEQAVAIEMAYINGQLEDGE
jgi:acetyl esterase/lipase